MQTLHFLLRSVCNLVTIASAFCKIKCLVWSLGFLSCQISYDGRYVFLCCKFWSLAAGALISFIQCLPSTILPPMQEMWVQSPIWEDSLEKEMATHSSILAWRIPWTEEPGGLQSMQFKKIRQDLVTKHTHTYRYTHTHQGMS